MPNMTQISMSNTIEEEIDYTVLFIPFTLTHLFYNIPCC